MPQPGGSGFLAPFVKALENKKSSEITLRLNRYEKLKNPETRWQDETKKRNRGAASEERRKI
jgi:hypothetical protein